MRGKDSKAQTSKIEATWKYRINSKRWKRFLTSVLGRASEGSGDLEGNQPLAGPGTGEQATLWESGV